MCGFNEGAYESNMKRTNSTYIIIGEVLMKFANIKNFSRKAIDETFNATNSNHKMNRQYATERIEHAYFSQAFGLCQNGGRRQDS